MILCLKPRPDVIADDVIQRQHVAEHSALKSYREAEHFDLLQNLWFGISRDGRSLVVVTTQVFHEMSKWYKHDRIRVIPLEWSAFYPSRQTEGENGIIDEELSIAKSV